MCIAARKLMQVFLTPVTFNSKIYFVYIKKLKTTKAFSTFKDAVLRNRICPGIKWAPDQEVRNGIYTIFFRNDPILITDQIYSICKYSSVDRWCKN
jgi:hypothetical protein